MFRVTHKGEGIDIADTIEGAREIVRGQPPGRYDVDEITAGPSPTDHTSSAGDISFDIRTGGSKMSRGRGRTHEGGLR